MASTLPAKLKTADILRYTQRATQLERIKPAIAYWCYYWVVNQILAKGLHQTDEECMNYTTELVDKLEQFKSQYPTDDSINDDVAGQASVEQFGLETFQRADNAVRATKASKTTAETFQAAATFLELVSIWSPPSSDIAAKIKYAKYHALRIARALKAGEDPNLSNPEPEVRPEEEIRLDPNDPEVKMINEAAAYTHGDGDVAGATPVERQATVEDVPDEHDVVQQRLARQSSIDQSLHPSRAPSQPRTPMSGVLPAYSDTNNGQPADIPRPRDELPPPPESTEATDAPFTQPQNPRQNSLGGGYFPSIPSVASEHSGQFFNHLESPDISVPSPSIIPGDQQDMAQDFYASAPSQPQVPTYHAPPPQQQPQYRAPQQPSYIPQPQQPQASAPRRGGPETYNTSDEAVALAQKHARWAISALNFEDVPTAVKELRIALNALGAE